MIKRPKCSHCRGAQYVLPYWLEKVLEKEGIHMTDIPPDVFKLIPVEELIFCHCNVRLSFFRRDKLVRCHECDGTTWLFTETAELEGWRWKKVMNLSADEIRALPCEYFERCPCGYDDQMPKKRERKKILKEVLGFLNLKIPIPSFGI